MPSVTDHLRSRLQRFARPASPAHPPLQGEGRTEGPGWGTARLAPRVRRWGSPLPAGFAVDPPPAGEGGRRRRSLLSLLAGFLLAASILPTAAQTYPSRNITIVVPYSAGGVVDLVARVVADQLRVTLGQSVIVENRVGAGGNVGIAAVANAQPDGHTLLLASPAQTLNPSLYSNLSWDPVRSFAPIGMIGVVPNVLVVHPSVPAKTLAEFIALAKAKPGQFNYASAGAGSSNHLSVELMKNLTGTDLVHVPYRGQPDALRDLLTGRVQFMAITMALVREYIANGQLTALAVTTAKRSKLLTDVPTAQEAGLPNFEVSAWFALFAPAGTPAAITDRLNADLKAMLSDPAVLERMRPIGLDPTPSSPDELAAFVKTDRERWAEVIKKAGIKLD